MAAFNTKLILLTAVLSSLVIGKKEEEYKYDFYSNKFGVEVYNYEDVC